MENKKVFFEDKDTRGDLITTDELIDLIIVFFAEKHLRAYNLHPQHLKDQKTVFKREIAEVVSDFVSKKILRVE